MDVHRVVRVSREIANMWLLHHDNAPSRTSIAVREFLAQNNHNASPPPYNPDLTPCDFVLFPKLKTHLKGHHFGTVENVQTAAMRALNNISSADFLPCYEEWQQWWNHCIRSQGAYFEVDKL
jgi:transposase